jgi:hypothetical protein
LAQKLFWSHLMELVGELHQVESLFGLLGEGVNIGAK